MILAERISELLEATGDRIADGARRADVAYPTFHDLVNGKSKRPSAETLYKIAKAYGVTVRWLMGEEGSAGDFRRQWAEAIVAEAKSLLRGPPPVETVHPGPNRANELIGRVYGATEPRPTPIEAIELAANAEWEAEEFRTVLRWIAVQAKARLDFTKTVTPRIVTAFAQYLEERHERGDGSDSDDVQSA